MDDSKKIFKRDSKVQLKKNIMLDRCKKLPVNYQFKIRYDTLSQNVILKELINIMGTTITDMDIELKMKIIRLKKIERIKFTSFKMSVVTSCIQNLLLIHEIF